MFSPLARSFIVVATAVMAAGCNVGLIQGPDRPEDPNVLGPPPPADFHCERGERRRETADAHSDRVVHVLGSGEVICSTEDRNSDGKVDTWNRIVNGEVVEQAFDSDFDGNIDKRVLTKPVGEKPYLSNTLFLAPVPALDGGPAK